MNPKRTPMIHIGDYINEDGIFADAIDNLRNTSTISTPENPADLKTDPQDKRIYDRDLNVEVKDGKYVG